MQEQFITHIEFPPATKPDKPSQLSSDAGGGTCEDGSTVLVSNPIKFDHLSSFRLLSLKQKGWPLWREIPKVVPKEAVDAPVLIPVSDGDYWLLARLDKDSVNGYHAWHSVNMIDWVKYGPVTSFENRWVTSAEHVEGDFYIYFDKPNDEDPHLVIDGDLRDGLFGEEVGMVFDDPTHGSDAAVFRDVDGSFHLIFEDWSPVNASTHSWDSPLAGHAISPDGIKPFSNTNFYAIDHRATSTGEFGSYTHPYSDEPYKYEIHEGKQNAYGDFSMVRVGDNYYLFSDYEPKSGNGMGIGRWRSDSLADGFTWDGSIGSGFHPDPTIGFAEGRFYLLVQRHQYDFVSDGPWVDGVEVRYGVDKDGDGILDRWSNFRKVAENYTLKDGYSRVIDVSPAIYEPIDGNVGFTFLFEMRLTCVNGVLPNISEVKGVFR